MPMPIPPMMMSSSLQDPSAGKATKQVIEAMDELGTKESGRDIPDSKASPADFSEDIARSANLSQDRRKEIIRESVGSSQAAEHINEQVMRKLSEAEFGQAGTNHSMKSLDEVERSIGYAQSSGNRQASARTDNIFMQEMEKANVPDIPRSGKPHP